MLSNPWDGVKRTPESALPYALLLLVVLAAAGWVWRWLAEARYGAAIVLAAAAAALGYTVVRYVNSAARR